MIGLARPCEHPSFLSAILLAASRWGFGIFINMPIWLQLGNGIWLQLFMEKRRLHFNGITSEPQILQIDPRLESKVSKEKTNRLPWHNVSIFSSPIEDLTAPGNQSLGLANARSTASHRIIAQDSRGATPTAAMTSQAQASA